MDEMVLGQGSAALVSAWCRGHRVIQRSSSVAWFPVAGLQTGCAGVLLGEEPNQAVIDAVTRVLPAVVGVDVVAVTPGSAADGPGLRQRALILRVNGVRESRGPSFPGHSDSERLAIRSS